LYLLPDARRLAAWSGSDGGLAGYRWDIHRKRAILEKEQETAPAPDSLFFAAMRPQNRV
jgi:hypothetical protein